MGTMRALGEYEPVMIAWKRYQETEEYENTKKWAVHPEHVQGSLWAAFLEGWTAGSAAAEARLELLIQDIIESPAITVGPKGWTCRLCLAFHEDGDSIPHEPGCPVGHALALRAEEVENE